MANTKFDEMRALYSQWEQLRGDRYHESVRLTGRLMAGFGKYIGVPEKFETFDSRLDQRKKETYLRLAKVSRLDHNDLYHFEAESSPLNAIQHDEDDETLAFGIIFNSGPSDERFS